MKDNSIDVEVVPVEVVRCPRCGARNRLVKQERHVGYKCGGCWAPLANPFDRFSLIRHFFSGALAGRNSPRFVGRIIGGIGIAIAVIVLVQHHDSQSAHSFDVPRPAEKVLTVDSPSSSPSIPIFPPLPPASPRTVLSSPAASSYQPISSMPPLASRAPLEKPAAPPRSLENGTILEYVINAGHGRFTVENGTDRDAVVKLIDQTKGQTVVAIYVTAHNSATANLIPEGIFTVLCGQGENWDEKINFFTRKRSFEKYEPDLDFTTKLKQNGNQITREYQQISLGLAPSIGGEMKESDMPENTFMEY